VRTPSDLPPATKPASHRGRRWIVVAAVLLVVVGLTFKTFAIFYTDALWFSSVSLHSVWLKLFEVKAGLMFLRVYLVVLVCLMVYKFIVLLK